MTDTQTEHRLRPLLRPDSIAYVGASQRPDSTGNRMVSVPLSTGYAGRMYPVNPNYEQVEGLTCYASLHDLPEPPDMVVLAVADQRLEAALEDALSAGARSAVIFGGANLLEHTDNPLPKRLAAIGREAALPICGGNCMGFYNLDHQLYATFSNPPYLTRRGGISLISHSGSSWSALTLNDGRLGLNLSVSSGQELTLTTADYLDYAVSMPTTRVVGLILETIRDPEGFLAALEKANRAAVPVVALKVGASEKSAELAISHSGAIAGDDAAYEAVFDRFGVSRVHTLEQLGAALLLLSQDVSVGKGALAAIHDSGFERELMVDRAEAASVPLADIEPESRDKLEATLDPGLEPVNPVDAWGTGHDYRRIFIECFDILMSDPNVALGFVSHNIRDNNWIGEAWVATALAARKRHNKPVAMVTSFPWTRHGEVIADLTEAGVALIEGMDNGLRAAAIAFEQRAFKARPVEQVASIPDPSRVTYWRDRLTLVGSLDEAEALALLRDFGLHTAECQVACTEADAVSIAQSVGWPVVLKTAMPDIHHKSDVDGVRVGLADLEQVTQAYRDLNARLGPRVTVAGQVESGVEMSLGVVRDPQFGSLIMLGAGGVLIELLGDRRLALPPFGEGYAHRLSRDLRSSRLLEGYRGSTPVDAAGFARAASRLSVLATELGDVIRELDINPIIVNENGAYAVDALIVPAG
ncbi:MAG: acetyl-CoA synthetase [Thiotrichales bacterium]|nr:acetyl-CoA synthetase [Thiotrichales bacterium]